MTEYIVLAAGAGIALLLSFLVWLVFFDKKNPKRKKKGTGRRKAGGQNSPASAQGRQEKKGRKLPKETEKILVSGIMPVLATDAETGAGIMEDGSFIDMLYIRPKDLNAVSDEDMKFDILMVDKLFRIYSDDLKIISINFPAETASQQEYLQYKHRRTENPVFRRLIEEEIDKATWISGNRTEKDCLLVFFAKDREEYKEKLRTIFGTLSRGAAPFVSPLSREKKEEIYARLYNKVFAV
jgi:hypothetical protein